MLGSHVNQYFMRSVRLMSTVVRRTSNTPRRHPVHLVAPWHLIDEALRRAGDFSANLTSLDAEQPDETNCREYSYPRLLRATFLLPAELNGAHAARCNVTMTELGAPN